MGRGWVFAFGVGGFAVGWFVNGVFGLADSRGRIVEGPRPLLRVGMQMRREFLVKEHAIIELSYEEVV